MILVICALFSHDVAPQFSDDVLYNDVIPVVYYSEQLCVGYKSGTDTYFLAASWQILSWVTPITQKWRSLMEFLCFKIHLFFLTALLIHFGLVAPYGVKDLGHHCRHHDIHRSLSETSKNSRGLMKTIIVAVLLGLTKIVWSPFMGNLMLKKNVRSCNSFGGPVKVSTCLPVLWFSEGPKLFAMLVQEWLVTYSYCAPNNYQN